MNEKKGVSRRVSIALETVCIILIVCLVAATSSYSWQINNKNDTISSLNSEIASSNSEIASLNSQIADQNKTISSLNSNITSLQNQNYQLLTCLVGNITLLVQTENSLFNNTVYYDYQIMNLQNQLKNLQNQLKTFQEPTLGFLNLTAQDNRTIPDSPYLHVKGTVHNFGSDATTSVPGAYVLYVKAYHNDGSVALDAWAFLGDINGQSSIDVDMNFYYNGTALASWTLSIEQYMTMIN
jgi:prefoldin subunit 5